MPASKRTRAWPGVDELLRDAGALDEGVDVAAGERGPEFSMPRLKLSTSPVERPTLSSALLKIEWRTVPVR